MRVDEHTISLDNSPIFYRSAPSSEVPVLYLHGVPTSGEDWCKPLERSGGLAPDLIGFGRSGKGGHLEYSITSLANFVERFLDELGLERVKLVGHGWGAAAGLMFAHRHPHRVQRLVAYDPLPLVAGFTWPRVARLWRRPVIGELLMGATNKWALRRLLRSGCVNPLEVWPDSRLSLAWEQFDQGTQRALLRLHRSVDERELEQQGERLAELPMEVLIVWGAHDPWYPVELAQRFAAKFVTSELEVVSDAGHWPWLDAPRVLDRVERFLAA